MEKKDGGIKNKNPLVSVCATFFNAEKYIDRLLESCLNQTYKNIEIVIVDDASTDNSEKVVREYMAQDPRISYYRNDKNIGLAESELKMFKLAKGEFSMMLGADDWLAKNYIENGVKTFLKYPDAAGIIPKLVNLVEMESGQFEFLNNALNGFIPPKSYSTEWFVKNMYRPKGLFVSALALVRTRDWVSAMNYYIEKFYHNPPEPTPDHLKRPFKMALGIDIVMFLEILTRYKYFIFDSSLNYIKIMLAGGQANNLNFKRSSLAELLKEFHCQILIHSYIYKFKWPEFYPGMKIFRGAQMLSTIYICFFGHIFSPSFLNFQESKKYVVASFKDFSIFEITMAMIYSVPIFVGRSFGFIKRKIVKNTNLIGDHPIFVRGNFLDPEKRFKVN